jgi:predicted esterase
MLRRCGKSHAASRDRQIAKSPESRDRRLPTTHKIEARTHGRYLVDRPPTDEKLPILLGFHGYGENAERMMTELVRIRGPRAWLLVSVQALNRFYNRTDESVVASWMTRQDRELAITDNLAYVAAVVNAVRRDQATTDVLIYAGFSQGVAMAYRAAAQIGPSHGVIALSGDVPPDVTPRLAALPPVLIGRGTTDHWYTAAKAAADLESFRQAGLTPTVVVFEGGHVWHPTFVERAGAFLESVSAKVNS